LDTEAHNTLDAKPVNADDADADDEGMKMILIVMMTSGLRKIQAWEKTHKKAKTMKLKIVLKKIVLNQMLKRQIRYMYGWS